MEFGLFTFSYLFGENGVTFSIKKETAFNVRLESSVKITNQDFVVPIKYSTENSEILKRGKQLDDDDKAYYLSCINWNNFFPQITNLVVLKSMFVYGKHFMLGDYSNDKMQLRVLFEMGRGNLNVFIIEKEYLPRVLHFCEFGDDIVIEHSGNKMLLTNPNRNCRQYSRK